MRSGQKKLVEKAIKKEMPGAYISFLEQSQLPLYYLKCAYRFFYGKVFHGKEKNAASEEDIKEDIELLQQFFPDPKIDHHLMFHLGRLTNSQLRQLSGQEVSFLCLVIVILYCNALPFHEAVHYADLIRNLEKTEYSKMQIGYGYILRKALTLSSKYYYGLSYEYYYGDCLDKADYSEYPVSSKIAFASAAWKKYQDGTISESDIEYFFVDAFSFSSPEEYESTFLLKQEWKDYFSKVKLEKDQVLVYSPYEAYVDLGKKMLDMNPVVSRINYEFPSAPVIQTKIHFSVKSFSICFLRSTKMGFFFDAATNEPAAKITGFQTRRKYLYYCDSRRLYYEYVGKQVRILPVTLRVLMRDCKEYGKPMELFLDKIIDDRIRMGDVIFKDLKKILQSPQCPPFLLSDFYGCCSVSQMCKKKYKKEIPIVWNKGNLFINYLVYKTYVNVEEKDRNILLNWNNQLRTDRKISRFFDTFRGYYGTSDSVDWYEIFLLANLILERISPSLAEPEQTKKEIKTEYYYMASDYVIMSFQLKRKIKLRFRSWKKVKEAHDRLVVDQRNRSIPLIKVPKNSVFHPLRKLLPKEFEWIRSRKRLVEEGCQMVNCVASYYNYINKDESAIYSFVYEKTGERYTIEFVLKEHGYRIKQIQSKYNRGCPEQVRKYVNSYLKEQSPGVDSD